MEKSRTFDPRGQVVLTPKGAFRLTPCDKIKITPESFCFSGVFFIALSAVLADGKNSKTILA